MLSHQYKNIRKNTLKKRFKTHNQDQEERIKVIKIIEQEVNIKAIPSWSSKIQINGLRYVAHLLILLVIRLGDLGNI